MNLLKVREIEVRNAAEVLLMRIAEAHCLRKAGATVGSPLASPPRDGRRYRNRLRSWLREVGPLGGAKSPKYSGRIAALVRVLRSHVHGEKYAMADLQVIRKLLNMRVSGIDNGSANLADLDAGPWFIHPIAHRERFAAEDLILYLKLYGEKPHTAVANPLGVCPACDGVFLKQRSKQKWCSDGCRFKACREKTRTEDPDYWARKARENRKSMREKKALAAGEQNQGTRKGRLVR